MLPDKTLQYIIPIDKDVSKIDIVSFKETVLEGTYLIYPKQPDQILGAEKENFVEPKAEFYGRNEFYPGKLIDHIQTGLSVNSTDSCMISINGLFGNGSYHNHTTGSSATFTNVPTNYIVSASKHNYFTYIAPLYLQNETITGSHYIHADKVTIGNNVTSERASGDFIVDDDASLTINATNTVTLNGGFSVELGGCFEIIH